MTKKMLIKRYNWRQSTEYESIFAIHIFEKDLSRVYEELKINFKKDLQQKMSKRFVQPLQKEEIQIITKSKRRYSPSKSSREGNFKSECNPFKSG